MKYSLRRNILRILPSDQRYGIFTDGPIEHAGNIETSMNKPSATSQTNIGAWVMECEPGEFKVSGKLEIASAELLHEILQALVAGGSRVQLDLSEVESCGTPGVQLLMAAKRSAEKKGVNFRVCHPSRAVQAAFGLLALRVEELQLTDGREGSANAS